MESIRLKDFTQLIGASTSGISLNYNQDKTAIAGSFNLRTDSSKAFMRMKWIQIVPSIGTTTNLYTLGQQAPQFDFSLSMALTFLTRNYYFIDVNFNKNYNKIKANEPLGSLETSDVFSYSQALRENLKGEKPKYKQSDDLYWGKYINWISIRPEFGGTSFTFFDQSRSFTNQIYKPYYKLFGLNMSFNHYFSANDEDVKFKKPYNNILLHLFYYSFGLRFGTNNNTDYLKKVTLNDITSIITNPTTNATRQIVKATSAYNGVYNDFVSLTPSFELLFSPVNFFAFDFFGNYNIITTKNTGIYNYGSLSEGLYFYTNTNGSKINLGIYYQHSLHVSPAKEIIGLKTKIPINW